MPYALDDDIDYPNDDRDNNRHRRVGENTVQLVGIFHGKYTPGGTTVLTNSFNECDLLIKSLLR